jgi:hypothetical protein
MRDGSPSYSPGDVGVTVLLTAGFANRSTRHADGSAWYHRPPVSPHAPSPTHSVKVRLPATVACKCGGDVRIDAPALLVSTYAPLNAHEPSRRRPE